MTGPGWLDGLFRIGAGEISWCKHHKYLTRGGDDRWCVAWGAKWWGTAALGRFVGELGTERSGPIEAV